MYSFLNTRSHVCEIYLTCKCIGTHRPPSQELTGRGCLKLLQVGSPTGSGTAVHVHVGAYYLYR